MRLERLPELSGITPVEDGRRSRHFMGEVIDVQKLAAIASLGVVIVTLWREVSDGRGQGQKPLNK